MWTNGEPGPQCPCGKPTIVGFQEGHPVLMCLWHSKGEGAFYSLPAARPDKWPDMTDAEMQELIEQGNREQGD